MQTKHEMLFKNLWDHSFYLYNNRPMKKVSNAFSIDLMSGKDVILSPKDKVVPYSEKVLLRNFRLIA